MSKFLTFVFIILFQNQVFAVKDGHAVSAQNPLDVKIAQTTVQIIGYSHRESDNAELCTGTLIGETYILTAAHCFFEDNDSNYDPNDMMATVSLLDVDGKKVETLQSEKIVVHDQAKEKVATMDYERPLVTQEMFNAQTYKEYTSIEKFFDKNLSRPDVAIIKLKSPFTKPHQVAKIYFASLKVNDTAIFAGYGDMIFNDQSDDLDKPLQLTTLRVREFKDLGAKLSSDDGSQIMVGDSGGPGYILKDSQLYVAFIQSTTHLYIDEKGWMTKNFSEAKSVATMMNLSMFKDFFNLYIDKGL